jgi:hypothetical protein
LGNDSKGKDAATRASSSAAICSRDKLQVEGTFHEMSSEWKEAIGIWQTLATFFPDDVEYALRLANAQIASGAPKEGLATIENFKRQYPAASDPRLDLSVALASETLSDFKRMQTAAAAAGKAAEEQGATLLLAMARLREGDANIAVGTKRARHPDDRRIARDVCEGGDQAGSRARSTVWRGAISDGRISSGRWRCTRKGSRSRVPSASRIWSRAC